MRFPFSSRLLDLAQAETGGALQATAVKALELWAHLGAAQAEAASRRDDRLSFHLDLLDAALSLPDHGQSSTHERE